MINRKVILALAIVLLAGLFALNLDKYNVAAATLCVDPGGGGGCFTTIQAAIDAANPDDIINVAPGTYNENLILNKRLTLNGARAGVDARGRVTGPPNPAVESIITAASGILLELQTDSAGSTINGFAFSGAARAIESTSGTIDNLKILNNFVGGFTSSGIFLNNNGVDITVDRNEIDGTSKTGGGGLFHLDQDNFDGFVFTNNNIVNGPTATGFFVDGNHNVGMSAARSPLISGNSISGQTTGMNLGRFAFEFGEISRNTFSNNAFDGLQGGIQNTTIKGNTFTGNGRSGLALTGFGGAGDLTRGAQNNTITCNTFTGNGFAQNGEAVFFSSAQFPGTISTNTVNQNNISGNNRGATYAGSETIDAENNWWGSATGPAHVSNPGGMGDAISDGPGVIDFAPFLTAVIPDSNGDGLLDPCEPVCIEPPANLVSWWTGDGNADDFQGLNDGALQNGATFAPGKVAQAFSFDGTDDFVLVPDDPSLDVGTGDFSIDAWIQTSNNTGVQAIVDKREETSPGVFFGYSLFTFNGNLGVQLSDGIFGNFISTTDVADGLLHFVAVTVDRDSSTGGVLYVDGMPVLTFDPTSRPGSLDNAGDFRIGGNLPGPPGSEALFNGLIDEVEFFDRALSAAEIQSIFDADVAGKCKCAITCPDDISIGNDKGQCGAIVDFMTEATSDCGEVTCDPASGSFFPVGTTTVTCTTEAGPACSFTVMVNDTEAPAVTCPLPPTRNNDPGLCSAVVTFLATAGDTCDGVITPVCVPPSGSSFPVGITTVTCTATDAAGNSSSCMFNVTVNDTEAPFIICPASFTVITPSPGGTTVIVNYTTPSVGAGTAGDNCGVASIVCNPPSGSAFPLGVTTVTCTVTDTSNNTTQCSFTVSTFDVCIEDDTNPGNVLLFISTGPNKGTYRICCGGQTLSGVGTIGTKNGVLNLTHFTPTRRVQGRLFMNQSKGSAALQSPPTAFPCIINDSNTANNSCSCSAP
ncbi:MAG: HYR domain-containing protein [Blastocatellia bacterium]|nr:HYR domain-containing protein [Blastocatellia bacterium]